MSAPDSSDNTAIRSTERSHDPSVSLEEAKNANEGKFPNGAGSGASSTAEEHVPGRDEPYASDLPSSDHAKPD